MESCLKVLFIQTAFIGDAILMTSMVESWSAAHPNDEIHVCVRKGNEGLFRGHPFVHEVWVWDKTGGVVSRYWKLFQLARRIRQRAFDAVFTPHRHASSGWLTVFSGANIRSAFSSHPLAKAMTHLVSHRMEAGWHEVDRNHELIAPWVEGKNLPRLHPNPLDLERAATVLADHDAGIVFAPLSQWGTKQWPLEQWQALILQVNQEHPQWKIVLMGGREDALELDAFADRLCLPQATVVAGWGLLEAAALMKRARAVVTNDSGPLHLASAVNAPTVAIFCSTSPDFGFGPLATHSRVVETTEALPCRPCGLHGHPSCPEQHFRCGTGVQVRQVGEAIDELLNEPA